MRQRRSRLPARRLARARHGPAGVHGDGRAVSRRVAAAGRRYACCAAVRLRRGLGPVPHRLPRLPRGAHGRPRDSGDAMTRVPAVVSLGVALLLCGVRPAAGDQTPDAGIVAAIHVRGNTVTPTEDIVGASGVTVGDVFAPDLPARVETLLRATGRFEGVDVRARFASIADPSRIALVIVVDERPVRVLPAPADRDEEPRVVRRGWPRALPPLPPCSGAAGAGV